MARTTPRSQADSAPAVRTSTPLHPAPSAQERVPSDPGAAATAPVADVAPERTVEDVARRRARCPATVISVSEGDSLWGIARARLGTDASDRRVARAVSALWELNADRMPDGPDLLRTGQQLRLPSMTCT